MQAALASLPLVVVSVLLALRVSAMRSATAGIVVAGVLIATVFSDGAGDVLPGLLRWLPTAVEVIVIIAAGIALARILSASGAQGVLAGWLGRMTGGQVATALLVVHGVTPFAESVTGFGVGVLVGVPLLAAAGFSPHRSAVLGLLGLCAVPWGALGPGTIIAGRLIGETTEAVGIATAWPNLVVTVGVGIAAVLMVPGGRSPGAVAAGIVSGLVLGAGILASSLLIGMAPSGALGGLLAVVVHLAWRRVHGTRITLPREVRHAVGPYLLLLGGILASTVTVTALDITGAWATVASPAVWLVLTCLVALRWLDVDRETTRQLAVDVRHLGRATALPTAAFLLLGVLMVLGGLTVPIGEAIQATGSVALVLGPALGAFGGFITGSGAGANSMFAAAQGAVAEGLGVSVLAFVGVQNAAAGLLTMASPARVLLAVRSVPPQATSDATAATRPASLSKVTREVLLIDIAIVLALGLWNVLLL
ncbi:L-lactate permease [Ornithinimicrobium sufpigmenti]|uniref:L-lactate permease n=1 Tax=Ornithinimicrobium sufpigmenti TaxID=2508882 RepID=UPI0010360F04|nr:MULTISPECIES: L-lactate permease [unclassified Ornithinimicrobium]